MIRVQFQHRFPREANEVVTFPDTSAEASSAPPGVFSELKLKSSRLYQARFIYANDYLLYRLSIFEFFQG